METTWVVMLDDKNVDPVEFVPILTVFSYKAQFDQKIIMLVILLHSTTLPILSLKTLMMLCNFDCDYSCWWMIGFKDKVGNEIVFDVVAIGLPRWHG